MNPLALINPGFSMLDSAALVLLLGLWLLVSRVIEHPPAGRPSVAVLMDAHRRQWMEVLLTRNPRIPDMTLIESLRQSSTFFASTSLIAIGAGAAMVGNSATLNGLAQDVTILHPGDLVRLKFALVVVILSNGLLKFVWASRLFSYCGILMAAVPNDPEAPGAALRAAQAAAINITAARNFNRGLRSIYTALGALGWLFGPWGLMVSAVLTQGLLIRREFASQSRSVLLATAVSDAALR